jgi:hypothetical protein
MAEEVDHDPPRSQIPRLNRAVPADDDKCRICGISFCTAGTCRPRGVLRTMGTTIDDRRMKEDDLARGWDSGAARKFGSPPPGSRAVFYVTDSCVVAQHFATAVAFAKCIQASQELSDQTAEFRAAGRAGDAEESRKKGATSRRPRARVSAPQVDSLSCRAF